MSMDSIDRNEWNNEESSDSDDSKLTVEFLESFVDRFVPESVGMNIMDSAKDIEPLSYKNLFEMITHNINQQAQE